MKLGMLLLTLLCSLSGLASPFCFRSIFSGGQQWALLRFEKHANSSSYNVDWVPYGLLELKHAFEMNLTRRARCIDCNQDVFETKKSSEIPFRLSFNGKRSELGEKGTLTLETFSGSEGSKTETLYENTDCD